MSARAPITKLVTHEVQNQPPSLEDYNQFDTDIGRLSEAAFNAYGTLDRGTDIELLLERAICR
jgi:hypothetical protein